LRHQVRLEPFVVGCCSTASAEEKMDNRVNSDCTLIRHQRDPFQRNASSWLSRRNFLLLCSSRSSACCDSCSSLMLCAFTLAGSEITSTYIGGGYESMSGTSMATPFVTGAFARCALTDACRISSSPGATPAASSNYPVVMSAARSNPCVSGFCGPSWSTSNNYGFMLNVRPL
jgi:hypothetical protein